MNTRSEKMLKEMCKDEYLLDSTFAQIRFGYGYDQIFNSKKNQIFNSKNIEVDVFALLLNENDVCEKETDVVFYNNFSNKEETVNLVGDCLSGCCECADYDFNLDLRRMPAKINKVLFAVVVYDAENRRQSISQLTNEFIYVRRIGEDFRCSSLEPVFLGGLFTWNCIDGCFVAKLCEFVRLGTAWKLRMLSQGYHGNLQELIADYGLELG